MEELGIYLLKTAGVLSIFVIVYHLLLRKLTFFNANRYFLLFGIAASILFPLIEITQTVYVEQPELIYMPQQIATPMAVMLQEPTPPPLMDSAQLLMMLYVSISLFFMGKMVVELLSLRRLINSGTRRRENGFVIISLSRKVTPFSFFKYICFYKNDEKDPANDLILKHEQVHARQWHSIDLLLSHLYCAVFWINPLAWLLKRQIGENLEFIADATAKVDNNTGLSYERTLLSSAASHMQPALANNFFTPFIKKRIQMLQKETSKKWNAYKYALILPVIVLFLYSFNTVTKTEYIKNAKKDLVKSLGTSELYVFDTNTDGAYYTSTATKINAARNYMVNILPHDKDQYSFGLGISFGDQPNQQYQVTVPITSRNIGGTFIEAYDDTLIVYDKDFNKLFVFDKDGMTTNVENQTLIFDITSTTTQLQLNEFASKINNYANFKTDLKKEIGDSGNAVINVYSAFNKKKLFKSFSLELSDGKLLLLEVFKNQLKLNNTLTNDQVIINEKGTTIGNSTPLLFDDLSIQISGPNSNSYSTSTLNSGSIYITFPQTATRESFEDSKAQLKEDYNVDLDIKTLKYKDGKIVNIKLELDDNKGSVVEYAAKSDTGINTFCINGEVSKTRSNWSVGNCTNQNTMNAYKASQPFRFTVDSLGVRRTRFKVSLDTFKTEADRLRYSLKDFNYSKQEMDSMVRNLQAKGNIYRINGNKHSDTLRYNNVLGRYVPGSALSSDKYNSPAAQNDNARYYLSYPPLVLVDGVAISDEEFRNFDNLRIESMTVLKDQAAVSLYGAKGKDGVILITTKTDEEYEAAKKRALKNGSNNNRWSKNGSVRLTNTNTDDDFLIIYTPNSIKGLRGFAGEKNPLILANGKKITETEFNNLDPNKVKLVNIFKREVALEKYGEAAKDGVIDIVLKSASEMKMTEGELQDKIFSDKRSPYQKQRDERTAKVQQILNERSDRKEQIISERNERKENLIKQRDSIKKELKSEYQKRRSEKEKRSGYLYANNQTYYFVADQEKKETKIFSRFGIELIVLPEAIDGDASGTVNYLGEALNYKIVESQLSFTNKNGAIVKLGEPTSTSRSYSSSSTTNSTASSTSVRTTVGPMSMTLTDFTEEEFLKMKPTLEEMMDADLELKTFKTKGDKIVKLKFDLNGTAYTYEPNNGIKSLTIMMEKKGSVPKVSVVTY